MTMMTNNFNNNNNNKAVTANTSSSVSRRRSSNKHSYNRFHIIGAFLMGCCFASAAITFLYFHYFSSSFTATQLHGQGLSSPVHSSVHNSVHMNMNTNNDHLQTIRKEEPPQAALIKAAAGDAADVDPKLAANHDNLVHPVAGLDCSEHDGPIRMEDAKEMAYWRDIQKDNTWTSPFMKKTTNINTTKRQYLTFEPDGGGWNNIRMSMETVLTMAMAMGRVLVLPPTQRMYLLGQTTFNFADFFPLQELAEEHPGLEIITMEQFLQETMGTTRNYDNPQDGIVYPPDNKKTAWDGDTSGIKNHLGPWLRSIALNPDWNPTNCIAAFPKSTDQQDVDALQ